jgi:benzodiazapine receptor
MYASEKNFKMVISLFVMNAVLIVGWNVLFFSHQMMGFAFIQAMLLIFDLLFLILFIWRFSRIAAYLLLPYSAWIIFSTVLTLNVWILN